MTWTTYTKEFARKFPRGVTLRQLQGGTVEFTLPCSAGHEVTEQFEKRMPPEFVNNQLASKGWLFRGNKCTCPNHRRKDDKPMERVTSISVPAAPPKAVTVDARKAKREVMTWLDQSFSVEKGRYDEGVNDAFIAKETGMSEQAVANLREEFYGPLREPAEVAAFRKRLSDTERAVDTIEETAKETFASMREQVAKLASELAAIVKRNGW